MIRNNSRDTIRITDKLKGNLKTRVEDCVKRGYAVILEGKSIDNYESTVYWAVLRRESTK